MTYLESLARARAIAALTLGPMSAVDAWDHGSQARTEPDPLRLHDVALALMVLCGEGRVVYGAGVYSLAEVKV